MIDHLRISVYDIDERERLWSSPNLEFHEYHKKASVYARDGYTVYESKQLDGVIFENFKDRMDIKIQPHMMKNLGVHNANDFSMAECIQTLSNFFGKLPISDFKLFKIRSMEAGINFIVDGYGKELVSNTQWWKRTRFRHHDELGYSKTAFSVNPNTLKANTHLILKFYAKHATAPEYCKEDTLRFELKSRKAAYFKQKLKMDSLADLFTTIPYQIIKDEILRIVDQLTILDDLYDDRSLSKKEKDFLNTYSNIRSWAKLLNAQKNKFSRYRGRYLKILDRTGTNVHRILLKTVSVKLDELTNHQSIKSVENFPPQKIAFKNKEIRKCVDYFPIVKGKIFPTIDLSEHYCQLTGISLKYEGPLKKGMPIPKYIRSRTFKHLKKEDYGGYLSLVSWLVPTISSKDFKLPKSAKNMNDHLCHVVRNRYASMLKRMDRENKTGVQKSSGGKNSVTYRPWEIEVVSKYINELIIK